MNVAAILLAAGSSSRMGRPKQLLGYSGTTLIRSAATHAVTSNCCDTHVVLGAHSKLIERELTDLPLHVHFNDRWEDGIGSSIGCGMRAAMSGTKELDAVVLLLADQPYITASTINRLLDKAESTGAPIVAATYQDTAGVPALFARVLFGDLLTLPPVAGAKHLIAGCGTRIEIPIPEAALDVDVPSDLASIRIEN